YKDNELLLGTFVNITSYDYSLNKSIKKQAVDSAFDVIRILEQHTNPFDPHSEIAEINSQTDRKLDFKISPLLYPLLNEALNISRMTDGAYDPTLWPVFKIWHFGTDSAGVPSPDRLRKYLKRVNWHNISLHNDLVYFAQPDMGIDLSGISKGYAVELARKAMLSFGLRNFIIDAGGNLGIEWHMKQPVSVYIRDPRKEGAFYGKFPVHENAGIATSGDYQDFFIHDSVVYHHILDPATGLPARGAVSVTVKAPNATIADGLSTALFVEGADKAYDFVKARPDLGAVIIYQEDDSLAYKISKNLRLQFMRLSAASPENAK
ncbi:MAG: FAD:protein FMN transferase, partial [Calditrichia bacterium]